MGVNIKPIDLDESFKTIINPVVINDISQILLENREALTNKTINVIVGDELTSVPSCDCEYIQGMDNQGVTCPECGTVVADSSNRPVQSQVWIRAPKGVTSLIHPNFLAILMDTFSKKKKSKGNCIISWLLDTGVHPPTVTPHMRAMLEMGFERGYEKFIANYENYIAALFTLHKRDYHTSDLKLYVVRFRHLLFPQHIPIIHKSLVVMEKNAMGKFADKSMVDIRDVVKIMAGIDADDELEGRSKYMKERRVAKATIKLALFLSTSITELMGKKIALWRQHCYGTRTHFCMRCVCSSITERHRYDVVRPPWSASVAMLKIHLASKLQRLGHTPREIQTRLTRAIYDYDPLIDSLFKELISESHNGFLYAIVLRNPSLSRASVQLLKIDHIKTDPKDATMGISILNVKGMNMDFDGDAVPLALVLDKKTIDALKYLEPHYSMYNMNGYGEASKNASLPKPVATILNNYINDVDTENMDNSVIELLGA
jgi:hypothetical protein